MIMNQKRNKEGKEYKITLKMYLVEGLSLVFMSSGVVAISILQHMPVDQFLRNLILGVAGVAIVGFQARQAYLYNELEYDNREHYFRFWVCFLLGLAGSFVCSFLPPGGWPFMPIYVLLALFSNASTGILSASVLLMISTILNNTALDVSFLYFVSGIFAVILFHDLTKDFKIGVRMFLSLACLLLCETEGAVWLINERVSVEFFVIPLANCILSGILLLGILKYFSSRVIYQYRDKYLELNDMENEILAKYRAEAKKDYMHSVHTAYFCERIAKKLSLDEEALKCAGYYHKVFELHPEISDTLLFPPAASEILREYQKKKSTIKKKETAVLLCADTVMSSIQYLVDKSNGQTIKYDGVIDTVFKKFDDSDTFLECDISMKELYLIRNIFKEEKLYYDFLR